jgi:hypothetical protein
MSEKIIKTAFDWDGKGVHKETFGYEGSSCATETAFVESDLGGRKGVRKFKAEALRNTETKNKRHVRA